MVVYDITKAVGTCWGFFSYHNYFSNGYNFVHWYTGDFQYPLSYKLT